MSHRTARLHNEPSSLLLSCACLFDSKNSTIPRLPGTFMLVHVSPLSHCHMRKTTIIKYTSRITFVIQSILITNGKNPRTSHSHTDATFGHSGLTVHTKQRKITHTTNCTRRPKKTNLRLNPYNNVLQVCCVCSSSFCLTQYAVANRHARTQQCFCFQ